MGDGGVLHGCVRFGVVPATGPRFFSACHHGDSFVAGPADSRSPAGRRTVLIERFRATPLQARPGRLS
jgi:hypothetical protein